IRRAGGLASRVRSHGRAALSIFLAAIAGASLLLALDNVLRWRPHYRLGDLVSGCLGLWAIGFASLPPAVVRYRCWCARQLRRAVAAVSSEGRAELLLPLISAAELDAAQIAGALAREFGLRTELTAAAAPDARGDEASPAGAAAAVNS